MEAPAEDHAEIIRRVSVMGTWARLEIRAPGTATASSAAEAAVRALEAAETRLSTWRDHGELARLNASPPGRPVPLSPALARDLRSVLDWWRRTGGAFNPAVGPLVEAWGLRTGGRRPSPTLLRAAVAASDPTLLELRGDRATRLARSLLLEEGAWGKGAALDEALRAALEVGATGVRINLGGQVVSSTPFQVEVIHPREPGRVVARWSVPAGSVATSGNGEREAPHILDPRTGLPGPDFGSVTVWAPSALDADVLATALFVMGPREGHRWIEEHGAARTLWVTLDGGRLRVQAVPAISDDSLVLPANDNPRRPRDTPRPARPEEEPAP